MKKPPQVEETDNFTNKTYSFFEDIHFAPISVRSETGVAVAAVPWAENTFLDSLLAAIKWIFLYVPGTVGLHFLMMGFALSFFYKDWPAEMILGTLGSAGVCSFMIMLGIGKLGDLRYLRVAASIVATSAIWAMLYSILILFIPGDFVGFFAKLTLPLTLLIGYRMKRDTDKKDNGFDDRKNN